MSDDRIINLVDGRLESDAPLDTFVETHASKTLDRRMFNLQKLAVALLPSCW